MRRFVLIQAVAMAAVLGAVPNGAQQIVPVDSQQIVPVDSQTVDSQLINATATAGDSVTDPTSVATTSLTPTTVGSVTGQLVDRACYLTRGADTNGSAHAKCTLLCAQKGHRLALVTSTGELYVVIGAAAQNDNAKLLQFINKIITLTGNIGVLQRKLADNDTKLQAGDGRRPSGREEGVLSNRTIRGGGFREGDLAEGSINVIEPTSAPVVVSLLQ